eukprot:5006720-Pyramimonas_sp.AAC.1
MEKKTTRCAERAVQEFIRNLKREESTAQMIDSFSDSVWSALPLTASAVFAIQASAGVRGGGLGLICSVHWQRWESSSFVKSQGYMGRGEGGEDAT